MRYIVVVVPTSDRRNVLLNCRHSVQSMIRYDAAVGYVVLAECHHSVLSMIRGVLLYVVELWGFLCQNKHILNLQVPGIDIATYGLANTAPDQSIQTLKVQEIHSFMLAVFCPIYTYFLHITFSISLPFLTHIRGHMARSPLPSPLSCLPSF